MQIEFSANSVCSDNCIFNRNISVERTYLPSNQEAIRGTYCVSIMFNNLESCKTVSSKGRNVFKHSFTYTLHGARQNLSDITIGQT